MLSFFSPARHAQRAARHPWITLAVWGVVIAAAVVSATQIRLNDEQRIRGAESEQARQRVEDVRGETPPSETVIVQGAIANVDDAQFRMFAGSLISRIRLTEGVVSADSYYESGDVALVSEDRATLIIPVVLQGDVADAERTVAPLVDVVEESSRDGFSVLVVGDGSLMREVNEVFEQDLQEAETIGLPAALVVLVFVFGAVVAAGIPVVLGLLGIVVAVGVTAILSQVFGINSLTVNMITMIGLAVGIDYTLFTVERFREERARGVAKVDAIVRAGNTASRAVMFSGITVIIALAGLLIVPSSEFFGMALGAILVVVAAVAIALTLLPAVLSLLGDRVNLIKLPWMRPAASHDNENGFWAKTTAAVVKHPLLAMGGATALLLAAAAPVLTMSMGAPGLRDMPESLESVQAFNILDEKFSAGRLAPAHLVFEADVNSEQFKRDLDELEARLTADSSVSEIRELEVGDGGNLAVMDVIIDGDAIGSDARDAVDRIRDEYVPAAFAGSDTDVFVGGDAASTNDYVDTMQLYLPIVIAFVLALSFVLLMMVFRSIVIPVKAIIMNLLSVGAAYGLVVLVFQHGIGAGIFGFRQSDNIAAFLPVFLFAVLFGLSMDYHVFLLSRIQERFLQTGDNTGAVAYGLRSTAHIITGAAAIMMIVFGGFAMGRMTEMQQVGFGLGVAVLIDATIVRSVLVPASMEMLGRWNWYLPSWLSWLPKINVEGHDDRDDDCPDCPPSPQFIPVGAGGD